MKTIAEVAKSTLTLEIYAHPTEQSPNQNDPSTRKTATVQGWDAALAWFRANGGCAKLQLVGGNGYPVRGWEAMRNIPGYGLRVVGYATPAA